jgi:hypothetical protein
VPYYPEHDTELQFDICFDAEDFNWINRLRYSFSKILTRDSMSRCKLGLSGAIPSITAFTTTTQSFVNSYNYFGF